MGLGGAACLGKEVAALKVNNRWCSPGQFGGTSEVGHGCRAEGGATSAGGRWGHSLEEPAALFRLGFG